MHPLLLKLQRNGLIEAQRRAMALRPDCKYYRLTAAGADQNQTFLPQWQQLAAAMTNLINQQEA